MNEYILRSVCVVCIYFYNIRNMEIEMVEMQEWARIR